MRKLPAIEIQAIALGSLMDAVGPSSRDCRRFRWQASEYEASFKSSFPKSLPVCHNPPVFAVWLQNLDPFIFNVHGYGPRWYGFSYVAAALCAFWLYRRLAQRGYTDLPPAKVADLITWVGLFGVLLGGRLGWIIFYGRFAQHAPEDHWWWARVWEGGMSSHGGIIGVVLSTFVLSRVWKVSWTGIGDSLCVVATVGIFLVRCANFVNGELYGHETYRP